VNSNRVGANLPTNFGNFAVAQTGPINFVATGNAVATLAIEGSTYIVRRITVAGATGNIALANVAIYSSSDGNASNIITSNTVLSTVTNTTTFQDLTLASAANTTVYSAGALFVKVNTASGNNNTAFITVFGDVVTP